MQKITVKQLKAALSSIESIEENAEIKIVDSYNTNEAIKIEYVEEIQPKHKKYYKLYI